jgi:PPP family 3-phenylpropionic acid transporter
MHVRPADQSDLRSLRTLFLLSGATGAALLPFFALLLRHRGLHPERIGLVLGATSLAGALATPMWSHVADTRWGGILVLRVSSFATAVAAAALMLTGTAIAPILLVVAVMAACSAPGAPLSDALAVGYLGPERMTEYGRVRLWASLGWAVAVLAFGALFERVGLGPVLPAYAVGCVLYGLWTWRLPAGAPLPAPAESRFGAVGAVLRASPKLAPFIAGVFIVSVASSAAWSFVGLRIVERGGGPFFVGLSASLVAFLEIPVMQRTAALGRRFGQRSVFVAGVTIYAVVFFIWSQVGNALAIALVASLEGIGFALVYVGVVVIVGRLVPPQLGSTGQALAQTFGWNVAPIAGTSIGGVVFARLGAPWLFGGCAALTMVGAAIVWFVLAGTEHDHGEEATAG